MGFIPRQFIDDLITRINIVDIIETRVQLKKRGANYQGLCPFHNEKTPSFNVNASKQMFHCFGCGLSGNVISFIMEYDRLDFVTAIETLAQHLGIDVPRENNPSSQQDTTSRLLFPLLEKASRYYEHQLRKHPDANNALNYLKQRGLTGQMIKHFHMGYAPPGWNNLINALSVDKESNQSLIASGMSITKENGGSYDRFRDRIMFPIRDTRGRVVGFGGRVLNDETPKYLNSPETSIFHKGKELYGLYEAIQSHRKLEQVVIVEGYMDVVALAQYGITFAVATLGTSTSKDHIKSLLRYTNTVTFCFDGDKAGRDAAWRALETCLSEQKDGSQFRFLFLPERDDPDSIVRREGKNAFLQRLSNSQLLSDVLLNHISEQVDIQSIDGKSRYLKLVTPYLKQIPPSAFQQLLLEQIGRLLRIDPERILHLTPAIQKQQKNAAPKAQSRMPSNLRMVIALLLQEPPLINHVTLDESLFEHSSGYKLLHKLIDIIKENPAITTAQILEHWRDDKGYASLSKLAAWQHPIPAQGIEQEFIDACQHLLQQQLQAQINALMTKANEQPLNHDEKQHLQSLIRKKKNLIKT